MNEKQFAEYVEKLKVEWSKVETVPAESVDKLRKLLGKFNTQQIAILSRAKVKFISNMAYNEYNRRKRQTVVK